MRLFWATVVAVVLLPVGSVVLAKAVAGDPPPPPIGPGATLQQAREHFADDLRLVVVPGGQTCFAYNAGDWSAALCFTKGPVKR